MEREQNTESVAPGRGSASAHGRIELLALGTELAQRFEILDVLGTGGYAVVYRAHDRALGREVALKVLRHDRISPSALKRLRREAAIARDVVHPRLVRIFDIEESADAVFLTMEVVEGGTLAERLTEGAVQIDQAVTWATQALEGLAALHGLGILHRDIKPGNLLLTAEGDIKVSDFGLALHLDRDETRATTHESVLGTLEYLSPEQALGKTVDARSDLYSLGVVLFEMIAGRLPFESQSSLGSLLERLKKETLPDLREVRPEAPGWLAGVVRRLLEREPGERYASAVAALAELGARSARSFRLRKRVAAAAVVALAVVAIAAAVTRERYLSGFARMVEITDRSVRAIDRAGRTLWIREEVAPQGNFATLRTDRLGTVLAAFLQPYGTPLTREQAWLDFLDPRTGRSLERIPLPSAHQLFPEFADTYGGWLYTLDLDGDGADELVATLAHSPFFPSYNVLVEPDGQRTRLIFASAGHHNPAGAVDLDGDGKKELLFTGVNNRMGWSLGIAAVRILPWIGESDDRREVRASALAPDLFWGVGSESQLAWYSLLGGRRQHVRGSSVEVDPETQELVYRLDAGEQVRLDYQGFSREHPSPLPAAEREALRRGAYERMREGLRLLAADRPDDAVAELGSAHESALTSGSLALVEWIERLEARALLRAGRAAEGLRLVADLHARSESASEIAFEAARTLHALGDLRGAIEWYRTALVKGASPGTGRNKFEVAQGLLFSLVEDGRTDEARQEAARFVAAYPRQPLDAERGFLAWQAGDPLPSDILDVEWGLQDLHRYWWLELRRLRGEPAEGLLRRLRAARPRISQYRPLFEGLEAELLDRSGAHAEAAPLARRALEDARRLSRTEPNYRVHLPILEERARRIGKSVSGPLHSASPPRSGE